MSDDPTLFTFFNEIGIIEQLARNRVERVLPLGLTLSQFSVLNHFVRLGDRRSPMELAMAFQVTKGAMTNTLKKLEEKGFVAMRANPDDGRAKIVTLTAKGRAARDKAIKAMAPVFAEAGQLLPAKDVARILPTLQKVRAALDAARN